MGKKKQKYTFFIVLNHTLNDKMVLHNNYFSPINNTKMCLIFKHESVTLAGIEVIFNKTIHFAIDADYI